MPLASNSQPARQARRVDWAAQQHEVGVVLMFPLPGRRPQLVLIEPLKVAPWRCPHGDPACNRTRMRFRPRTWFADACMDCKADLLADMEGKTAAVAPPAPCLECARGPCEIALMPGEACPCTDLDDSRPDGSSVCRNCGCEGPLDGEVAA